jgi:hypothetical protein
MVFRNSGISVCRSIMVDITVIKGGTAVRVHIASTVGEVRKAVNDMSTKMIVTLMLHVHK